MYFVEDLLPKSNVYLLQNGNYLMVIRGTLNDPEIAVGSKWRSII